MGSEMCIRDSSSTGFLIAHGEVLPRKENSVTLSKRTDSWGIRIPHIEFKWSENELNMAKHMESTIRDSIKAADGKIRRMDELLNIPYVGLFTEKSIALSGNPPPPGYYIHEVGGAAMGFSEEESCLLYTSPSPRDRTRSRMPSSA